MPNSAMIAWLNHSIGILHNSPNHAIMGIEQSYFPRVWYVWVWPLAGMLTV